MNKKIYSAIAAGMLVFTYGQQQAGACTDPTPECINLNGYAAITRAGQTFTFIEEDLPQIQSGSETTFTIWAKGDFSPGNSNEYLSFDFDGAGDLGGPENGGEVQEEKDWSNDGGTWFNPNNEYNEVTWSQDWIIDDSVMESALEDGTFQLTIDLSDDVNIIHRAGWGENGKTGDSLFWELCYVPESDNPTDPDPDPGPDPEP